MCVKLAALCSFITALASDADPALTIYNQKFPTPDVARKWLSSSEGALVSAFQRLVKRPVLARPRAGRFGV